MSEHITDQMADLLDEAATDSYSKIKELVDHLIEKFSGELDDQTLAQNQLLIALTNVTGHLIAGVPVEFRNFIEAKALENISIQRKLAEALEDQEETLATITPQGNC